MRVRNRNTCRAPHPSVLPRETLEIADRKEILIAGVSGIEDYHTERVRVRTCRGIVEAAGDSILLCWSGEKRLLLRGNIREVRFEEAALKGRGRR